MKYLLRLAAVAASAWALSGCSHWNSQLHRCNPIGRGSGEDCLLPYPSSFYTRPDPTSPTGVRVDLTDAALPVSSLGVALDPSPFNQRDGFSSVATLLAHFPGVAIDPSNLPGPDQTARSLRRDSPVQLVRADTGERVPLFAELDANAEPRRGDKQAVIIQPIVRLAPRTRYVALIQGLRTRQGAEVAPLTGFRKLRDGQVDPGSSLAAEKDKFEEVFAVARRAGLKRAHLQLAWDFTTGSDEAITGRLVRMRDTALGPQRRLASDAGSGSGALPVTIRETEDSPANLPGVLRRLKGSFGVPSFLEDGNGNRLSAGPDGQPIAGPLQDFPLTIQVPDCAREAKGPLPVMIYGHGTFNSAENEMGNAYSREIINRLCVIQVGTDWLGRSRSDLSYFLLKVIPNWNNFRQITDRLQQAHVNVAALARLIRSGALSELPELRRGGRPLVDSSRLYYYGISEGGCQGITTLALSGDIDRGALNVPCGFWTMFFSRSSDYHYWRWGLKLTYPGELERQKLLVLSQLLWDYTDPANFGAHVLKDPLPGSTPKRILYQEGINDASVPNLTTRAMARTIGLKLLGPGVEPVEGIESSRGPLESAYVQFDPGVRPRVGGDNIPPAQSSVHEDVRRMEPAKEQLARFFRRGVVEDTCGGGPCGAERRISSQ